MSPAVKDRSLMLFKVRSFFYERGVLEADCPILLKIPSFDLNIETIKTDVGYLHTSPEYSLKKKLFLGFDSIFFLGHVFRKNEKGRLHNEEFTMIEWYRKNMTFDLFLEEVLEVIALFIGPHPVQKISYREALQKYAEIDCFAISEKALQKRLGMELDRDSLLNLAMAELVEPHLKNLTLVYNYPLSQSIFSEAVNENEAERFEIYFNGIELANGCKELSDPAEQRKRLEKNGAQIDEEFLKVVSGLTNTYGIAVGFDRLMLLKHSKKELSEVIF